MSEDIKNLDAKIVTPQDGNSALSLGDVKEQDQTKPKREVVFANCKHCDSNQAEVVRKGEQGNTEFTVSRHVTYCCVKCRRSWAITY